MSSHTSQAKADYFEILRLAFRQCLEPMEACEAEAIRAHSVQNSNGLDLLARDGHVIMLRIIHQQGGEPTVDWEPVGRNSATTFTGLCAQHDSSIFRAIDTIPLDLSSAEQLFLFAYRSVLREMHAVIEGAMRLQTAYLRRVDRGKSPADRPDHHGLRATEALSNAYDTYVYKRSLDRALLERDFGVLMHKHLYLEASPPSIAVSSLFSLDDMPWPDDVARVILNVIPTREGTHAIFSFLVGDADIAAQYLHRVLTATESYQKYLLSKLVLQNCDNIVIAPPYFERLSEVRKNKMREFFENTIVQNGSDYEDENLYLF